MQDEYDIFQVFIDDKPQRKTFKRLVCSSGRMLGIKRNFKKYAEKYGFMDTVEDPSSWINYCYRNENGNVMHLRLIKTDVTL